MAASWLSFLSGQEPVVSEITVVGNDHTRDKILMREIQHPLNISLDQDLIREDRDRLENLGIFSMVTWHTRSLTDSTLAVEFFVVETWRVLPGLSPYYDEKTGWSLSGVLIINNFRGRNQTLTLTGFIGGITSYSLGFYDPWIIGDHVSLNASFDDQHYDHFFLPYEVHQLAGDVTLGKVVRNHHKYRLQSGLEETRYQSQADTTTFHYWTTILTYAYDTRDIYTDPSRGLLYQVNTEVAMAGKQSYVGLKNSFGLYRRLAGKEYKLVGAAYVQNFVRIGYTDPLMEEYIGSAYSVRGWTPPDRQVYADPKHWYRFGTHRLTGSVELRQTIIPRFVTALKNESGLSVAGFFDFGFINSDFADLLKNDPLFGIGIGLRIPMPMLGNIRLDYGWGYYSGKFRDDQFHLAFGQKF